LKSYHSGATDDLEVVLQHILKSSSYRNISLAGFSLGGNVVLKYLGEKGSKVSSMIRNAVTFSVPCDLKSSALKLAQKENFIYMKRFLLRLN
jgi:predicted alpha/beta-fold hydrolase